MIGHEQGKGRNASVTGALRCRMECGKEFSVGSGYVCVFIYLCVCVCVCNDSS